MRNRMTQLNDENNFRRKTEVSMTLGLGPPVILENAPAHKCYLYHNTRLFVVSKVKGVCLLKNTLHGLGN